MGVLEKVERKVDEMSKHASIYAEVSGCSLETARFRMVAQRVALLELGVSHPIELNSGSVVVEPQPSPDEPPPPTQRQFASFVACLTSSGGMNDDQKLVFAWLKFKAGGGLHG